MACKGAIWFSVYKLANIFILISIQLTGSLFIEELGKGWRDW
jgi:hypothetical protein